jgi:hypothetical protein
MSSLTDISNLYGSFNILSFPFLKESFPFDINHLEETTVTLGRSQTGDVKLYYHKLAKVYFVAKLLELRKNKWLKRLSPDKSAKIHKFISEANILKVTIF